MPYPVSPPALPPVVDLAVDLANHTSTRSSSQVSVQVPTPRLDHGAAAVGCSTPTTNCSAQDLPAVAADADLASYPVAPPAATGQPTPIQIAAEEANRQAALLGQPMTIHSVRQASLPVLPTETFRVESPEQPATFLQLPDLDSLQQARFSRRTVRPDAATARPSTLRRNSSDRTAFEQLTGFAASRRSALAQAIPAPAPDSSEVLPQAPLNQPSPALQPAPPLPESLPLDLSEPLPSALPQPAPEPAGGQILTIPTEPETPEPEITEPGATPAPTAPLPGSEANDAAVPVDPQAVGEVLEVRGDRQEFDEQQQIFQADGNVEIRFRRGVLTADRVRVNLPNRLAVAEGNAVLRRGAQVLRGERFEYSFGLNQGNIQTARGDLLLPAVSRDFDPETTSFNRVGIQSVTEQVSAVQPLQVVGSTPGPVFGLGSSSTRQGQINRLRFEAEQAEFNGETIVADNVSITNDPFSPPELELRSNRVTYRRLSPFQAEIVARNPRLVFDDGLSLPLLVNRLVLDNRERDPGFLRFGFDERDRDGFYVERMFTVYSSPIVNVTVTPQLLIQRAIDQGGFPTDLDHYGLVANADLQFTRNTTAQAIFNLSSLDFSQIDDSLRMSLRGQQRVFNHTVALEYSYRNRLFNGSLGFQDIHSSVGLVVTSPRYVLGNSLINLSYQGSLQYVNAQTDQADLYNFGLPDRDLSCIDRDDRDTTGNGCADLTRYQGAVTLSRLFFLWTGTALPATPTEGLRYSPIPLTPYVGVNLDARGVYSGYSNGEHQASLRGGVTLLGQFGHFSRPLFDYTAFTVGYANTLLDGKSPFLFDRVADEQVLTASLTQQIYGPLRFGVQVSYNLTTGDDIDTVYTLEYSRRTYTISANYSTGRRSAALTFRLNDFNWTGDAGPFSGLGSGSVEGGVETLN